MQLNDLYDNYGARKKSKRVGRGIGSGKGKTCGSGGKGQTARSGVAIKGFEGGQTPIHRRLPKRGFNNPFRQEVLAINFVDLEFWFETEKMSAAEVISKDMIYAAHAITKKNMKIKLLANGELTNAIKIEVDYCSATAKEQVEKAGGQVIIANSK